MSPTGALFRVTLLLITTTLGFVATAGAAFAYTFDGSAAASYAHRWASNTEKLRNDNYKTFDQDCTNFVSQALRAGGWPDDESGDWKWYYNTNGPFWDTHSDTWTVARRLANYILNSGRYYNNYWPGMRDRYTPADKGDVYVYEWGDSDGWDHVSLASGWGDFANYYDSGNNKNYRSVTGGYGDYMSQHTRDRDYAPWNWGYWVESDLDKRSRMKTALLDVK